MSPTSVDGTTLLARPFDPDRAEWIGNEVGIADDIAIGGQTGRAAAVSVSATGALVYQSGGAIAFRVAWLDRSGREAAAIVRGDYRGLVLSPDERRVAMHSPGGDQDIWMLDVVRGVASRFTFESSVERDPVWSPDGQRVAFWSDRGKTHGIYEMAASGTGEARLLVAGSTIGSPRDWSPDGRYLLYESNDTALQPGVDAPAVHQLWALSLADHKSEALTHGPFGHSHGHFSPDGRWITYFSAESGRAEIYVQRFPAGDKWQVSKAGGHMPQWGRDGKEMYFLDLNGSLVTVPVRLTPKFEPGMPAVLFKRLVVPTIRGGRDSFDQYSVTRDGRRFLFNVPSSETTKVITLLTNWPVLTARK